MDLDSDLKLVTVFIDFKKAFDTLNHAILTDKLDDNADGSRTTWKGDSKEWELMESCSVALSLGSTDLYTVDNCTYPDTVLDSRFTAHDQTQKLIKTY